MALDKPNKNDKTADFDGILFIVETNFYDSVKPISVDYIDDQGFEIVAQNLPGGCSGCSCK